MSQGRFRKTLDIVATVSVTVASVAVVWSIFTTRANSKIGAPGGNAPPKVENLDDKKLQISLPAAAGGSRSSARVALIEFSDFECPFCGKYARETLPLVKRDFVDTQKVAYRFVNFPLETIHPNALAAAKAAICARRQSKFWEMHDWLFENQASLNQPAVVAAAPALGMHEANFATCVDRAGPDVNRDTEEGKRLGVNSTPTFLLGVIGDDGLVSLRRRINGAVPYSVFRSHIEGLLKEAL